MSVFFRFVMTLLANVAWQRIGGKGAVPPVRLPRTKGPINIPVLTPWQMMAAMWVARKAWGRYGNQVKSRIDAVNHPAARQVGAWLPDPDLTASAPNAGAMHAPRTWTTTAQPAAPQAATAQPAPSAAAPPPTSRPARDYDTRKLDDDSTNRKKSSPFARWHRPAQS